MKVQELRDLLKDKDADEEIAVNIWTIADLDQVLAGQEEAIVPALTLEEKYEILHDFDESSDANRGLEWDGLEDALNIFMYSRNTSALPVR